MLGGVFLCILLICGVMGSLPEAADHASAEAQRSKIRVARQTLLAGRQAAASQF